MEKTKKPSELQEAWQSPFPVRRFQNAKIRILFYFATVLSFYFFVTLQVN